MIDEIYFLSTKHVELRCLQSNIFFASFLTVQCPEYSKNQFLLVSDITLWSFLNNKVI